MKRIAALVFLIAAIFAASLIANIGTKVSGAGQFISVFMCADESEALDLVRSESCLRDIVANHDYVRAGIICILHKAHILQRPLRDFCDTKNPQQAMPADDIEQRFFDLYTRRIDYFSSDKRPLGEEERGSIGVFLRMTKENEIVVCGVLHDGPAAQRGLRRYDIIEYINGVSVAGKTMDLVAEQITGFPGSEVTLTIRRNERSRISVVAVRMADIEYRDYHRAIIGKFGYLYLETFRQGIFDEIINDAVPEFMKESIQAIILDLRCNPGGRTDEAEKLMGIFLGERIAFKELVPAISSIAAPVLTVVIERSNENMLWLRSIPLVVLVDQYSASSAEIVAGGLALYQRSLVVGRKTEGKGSLQYRLFLPDGSPIEVTMGRWFFPNGKPGSDGVVPRISFQEAWIDKWALDFQLDPFFSNDEDFLKALSVTKAYVRRSRALH